MQSIFWKLTFLQMLMHIIRLSILWCIVVRGELQFFEIDGTSVAKVFENSVWPLQLISLGSKSAV